MVPPAPHKMKIGYDNLITSLLINVQGLILLRFSLLNWRVRILLIDTLLKSSMSQKILIGLFSILNHKIIDFYRKKIKQPVKVENQVFSIFFDAGGDWKVEKRPGQWSNDDEHLLYDVEFQGVLKKCMDELPEKWNTCVKLRYLMNKNGEEICQELDISPTNFWQVVYRAKSQLRNCVEENGFKN